MLEYEGLCSAIAGCTGVIHLASPTPFEHIPIPNPVVEFVESAIKGTRNVLNACLKAKVKKVVVVSSVAAVMDQPIDENCWSDPAFCKQLEINQEIEPHDVIILPQNGHNGKTDTGNGRSFETTIGVATAVAATTSATSTSGTTRAR
ncbi:hypothetical protein HYC85_010588 [Camellia sinensis]|uniref:3-beta hydroxysteroid dehydrogenase/isomerase domain-containing protein n=1 Tax=Camellia sinensis TaxID=4442 RepID=A0A7J7HKX5_CAMSI|nr:hypothetical protein HYC85_010588 [Camellia sinensis]